MGSSTLEEGLAVLHLFCHPDVDFDPDRCEKVVATAVAEGTQVVTVSMFGHKADIGVMALSADPWALRHLQTELTAGGLRAASSYFSLTEISEYAAGLPEEMRQARLYPELPPEGMEAYCFYPMTKRRDGRDNWYLLDFDERLKLMHGHGAVGRTFRGRVLQLITGSVGLDDWEWGVSLFGRSLVDLKDCVYTMRFDEASARYAEFGPFWTGLVGTPAEVLSAAGR